MEPRRNVEYTIINTIRTAPNTEVVLGEYLNDDQNMWVTWICQNGKDYFWGHYFTDEKSATIDFLERALNEIKRMDP